MLFKNIKNSYDQIFSSYGHKSLDVHIKKIMELDAFLPHSSTFFCLTNTQNLSFEYISNNMFSCLGLDPKKIKEKGMRYFWSRIHPEDLDSWLSALNMLMVFTIKEIPEEDRKQ
ncbi:MAG: hypothetical protein ACI93N_002522, partial [Flavobacteriaceae bacterium]